MTVDMENIEDLAVAEIHERPTHARNRAGELFQLRTAETVLIWKDLWEKLSPMAQTIILIILNMPEEVFQETKKVSLLPYVSRFFIRRARWKKEDYEKALEEVREFTLAVF